MDFSYVIFHTIFLDSLLTVSLRHAFSHILLVKVNFTLPFGSNVTYSTLHGFITIQNARLFKKKYKRRLLNGPRNICGLYFRDFDYSPRARKANYYAFS